MTKVTGLGWSRNYVVISPSSTGETLLDIDQDLIEAAYKKYGALLFRGYALDMDFFSALSGQFCTHAIFNEIGGRDIVNDARVIQTVNRGSRPFLLHPELSREPWRPDVCWFGCITPPTSRGQTTICDGTKLVRKMLKRLRKLLDRRSQQYRRVAAEDELKYWLNTEDLTEPVGRLSVLIRTC